MTGALSIASPSWGNQLILHRTGTDGTWGPSIWFYNNNTFLGSVGIDTSGSFYKGDNGNTKYKIWHEGNDGSGSGLDADTLDGNHASSFATASHTHNEITPAVDSASTVDDFIGFSNFRYSKRIVDGTPNLFTHESGNNANTVIYIPTSYTGWGTQLGFNGNADMFLRAYQQTTPGSWKTVIHSGNIGNQSVASATNATNSTNATYLSSFAEAGGNEWRYVWMSYSDNSARACYKNSIMFNPNTGTLRLGNTNVTGALVIDGVDSDDITSTSTNPRIVFTNSGQGSNSQNVALIYTRYDSVTGISNSKGIAVADYGGGDTNTFVKATYFIGSLVGNASTATSATSASSATNADKVDNEHASAFAHRQAYNNMIHSSNEYTWISGSYSGEVYVNYRTASGNCDGSITKYNFCNGGGSTLSTIGSDIVAGGDLRAKGNDMYLGSASGSQCHQQYDVSNECLKFLFD